MTTPEVAEPSSRRAGVGVPSTPDSPSTTYSATSDELRRRARRWRQKFDWRGKTTWFVRGTESEAVTGLPEWLKVSSLEDREIRAAIELHFLSRALLDEQQWQRAQVVSSTELPGAARTLLQKMSADAAG